MRRDNLIDRVLAYIRSPEESAFEPIAMALHEYQAQSCPVRSTLGEAGGSWRSIPAVPVSLFKALRVGTQQGEVVFRTSGTTVGARGEHWMVDTTAYDAGAVKWARSCVPHMPPTVLALLADPRSVHDSSLAHMVDLFAPDVRWFRNQTLDHDALNSVVVAESRPLFVCSTAFALVEWLRSEVPPLPSGSVLMVTGGFKGKVEAISEEQLWAQAGEQLQAQIVTEYGMTELSSQLWGAPGETYRPPPWMRVLAVDPATGAPLAAGEEGQLRFVDLCNIDSSVAIDTLDAGVVQPDGSVRLHGRLADSPARGCSITVEESW